MTKEIVNKLAFNSLNSIMGAVILVLAISLSHDVNWFYRIRIGVGISIFLFILSTFFGDPQFNITGNWGKTSTSIKKWIGIFSGFTIAIFAFIILGTLICILGTEIF